MSIVPGKEMGDVSPNKKINGKNAADVYWKAMADLHRLGIAHNDAHPHNLMVDNKGKGRWVDMGYAQQNPKAALAEALGAFTRSSKERGGNWQAQSWESTGINKYMAAKRVGGFAELRKEYPIFGKVVDNFTNVQQNLMRNYGFSRQEVDKIIDHGIRSDLGSYNKGTWSKITDKQAQDLLNTLYNGI
jgi:predicted unusual protein kinase regulating ubiquinone biosynthesis (AarF/ABC1/UbiB family)